MVENTLKKAAYYKDVNDKHRGLILYSYLFHDLWIPNGNDLIASFLKDLKINYPHGWQVNRSHGYLLPRFWQYKSNRGQIIMDSVLFYNAFKCLTSYRTCSDENKNDFMRELIAEKNNILLGRTLLRLNETRIGVNELEMRKRFPYYESMRDRGVSESISKRADGCTFRSINRYYDRNTVEKTKRAITNALAIRTMRLNGTLPHSSLD